MLVAGFIVIATRMVTLTDLIAMRGVSSGHVARMVFYLLPDIILFALPAAALIAVVLAFLRLSADSEMIALKSSGISLYQLLPPITLFLLLAMGAGLMISLVAMPRGNSAFRRLVYEIAETGADFGIKECVFCEPFDGIMFYVNHYDEETREIKDVFVSDKRDETANHTILAEKGGVLFHAKEKIFTLMLQNGHIFVVDNDLGTSRIIRFKTYDLNIDLKETFSGLVKKPKKLKEMTQSELIAHLRQLSKVEEDYNEAMIELLEKYTIPLAVFLMGFIGVSLGIQLQARGRSMGIGVSMIVFVIYYLCLAAVRSICETGVLPPLYGLWLPDVFLLVAGVYFLHRAANEKPIVFVGQSC